MESYLHIQQLANREPLHSRAIIARQDTGAMQALVRSTSCDCLFFFFDIGGLEHQKSWSALRPQQCSSETSRHWLRTISPHKLSHVHYRMRFNCESERELRSQFSVSELQLCVLNAAPFESSWWRCTANHRTVFTYEMRMTIACNISCSPNIYIYIYVKLCYICYVAWMYTVTFTFFQFFFNCICISVWERGHGNDF